MVELGAHHVGRSITDLKVVSRLNCCVSDNQDKARNAVRLSVVRTFLTYPSSLSKSGLGIPDALISEIRSTGYTHSVETLTKLAAKIPDSVIDASTLAGTVEGVADNLVQLINAGMDEVIIRPSPLEGTGIEETLSRFATEVIPKVKEQISG
jgi:5,10-methylenetetrahydromethanopterin reductase